MFIWDGCLEMTTFSGSKHQASSEICLVSTSTPGSDALSQVRNWQRPIVVPLVLSVIVALAVVVLVVVTVIVVVAVLVYIYCNNSLVVIINHY